MVSLIIMNNSWRTTAVSRSISVIAASVSVVSPHFERQRKEQSYLILLISASPYLLHLLVHLILFLLHISFSVFQRSYWNDAQWRTMALHQITSDHNPRRSFIAPSSLHRYTLTQGEIHGNTSKTVSGSREYSVTPKAFGHYNDFPEITVQIRR